VAYHEALWVTAGSVAPVLALAHALVVVPWWRDTQALVRMRVAEVTKTYFHARGGTNVGVSKEPTVEQQQEAFDRAMVELRFRRSVIWAAVTGAFLSWAALVIALVALAAEDDWLPAVVPIVCLGLAGLLLATPFVAVFLKIAPSGEPGRGT
jgi:hypothetical protein